MSGRPLAVVDTGPLFAAIDADDAHHERCRSVLSDPAFRFVVPALVVAEVLYLVGKYLGPGAETRS